MSLMLGRHSIPGKIMQLSDLGRQCRPFTAARQRAPRLRIYTNGDLTPELHPSHPCYGAGSQDPCWDEYYDSLEATKQVFDYTQVEIETQPGIALFDITPQIRQRVEELGVTEGFVNVLSRHTTTAVAINEYETRLLDDIRQFLRKLAPPSDPYLHNDLHLRQAPKKWPGGWKAWAAQEPENAHSHLLSMVLGNSETVPVSDGQLCIGTWQSVMLVELDGPRKRTVGIQVVGTVPTPPR